jgi:MazG family protein
VLTNWEMIKAAEREASGKKVENETPPSLLAGVSTRLPGLLEAYQLQTKAARVGFDWPQVDEVFAKLEEEIRELRQELQRPTRNQKAVDEEVGDILFVLANLARWVGTEPESGLKAANRKFRRRFAHIEKRMVETGRAWNETTLAEMDQFWNEAKEIEKAGEKGGTDE